MKALRALIADVPYSNKKLASMDMEERYRLIISTILNAIGMRVDVERMLSTGRIDILVRATRYIYVIELKLKTMVERKLLYSKYLPINIWNHSRQTSARL